MRLETSKGIILLELHRDWSPHGADRFYNLVRAGFYDEARFFRVIKERWAQFGINGEPRVARVWQTQTIPDDPRKESNVRGTIAFAFAVPNGRTTQVFINLRDNSTTHDAEPFVPFGRVIEGIDVADALNAEYGESAGGGIRAGKQAPLFEQGNRYLNANFPRLDYIQRAVVVEAGTSANQNVEFAAKERIERRELGGFGLLCVLCVLLRLFQSKPSWFALLTGRKRFSRILAVVICGSSHLIVAAEKPIATTLENGGFRLSFDEHGLTGLANPKDPFGAQMLAPNQHLGVTLRYHAGDTNWQELAPNRMLLAATNSNSELIFTNDFRDDPLSLTEKFTTDGSSLDWELALQTTTNIPVDVGDLAISLPVVGPRGEQPKEIFEHGFLRHQFISGDGSFLYYVRASGVPPFLLVTVRPGTHLEYFMAGAGRGGGPVFIHSGLSGGRETRGTWRQEHSFLKLGAKGAANSKVRYGFRFQWANSYDEMRDLLYGDGLFDIRAVPGMVVPTDLTARFALHTQARIDSIQPEFPNETKITELGKTRPGYHLYEVAFRRLGENLLTIQHDGGRKTYLEYFATEPLETLIKKRSSFIISRQQIRDPSKWWDGVFGPYDMKHKVLRTIDDPDIFTGRMIYVLTCDDPGLCKAPFVAEKNVAFPDRKEIEG
ncbi:MAG TPA: peptidylprolyl isomerase, partial [Candidatus Acidoferrum sp.]|nr:peptidylprolyl isomerase [Candidatus Acidoferrum sp.]